MFSFVVTEEQLMRFKERAGCYRSRCNRTAYFTRLSGIIGCAWYRTDVVVRRT